MAEEGEAATPGDGLPGLDAYHAFFTGSAVPSLLLDVNRRQIVAVNPAAEQFLGLPAEAIIGRPGADFLHEPTHDEVLRARALRGQSTNVVRYVQTARGPRTAEIVVVPTGDITFVQAVDLTDLIEANAALEEQARSLEKSSAMLQTVASRVAHDLRGPLAAITGYLDLLIEDETDDDKLHMLDRVRSNGAKLAEMVERVLGEARNDAPGDADEDAAETHSVARLFASVRRALQVQLEGEPDAPGPSFATVSTVTRLPVPASALEQPVVNLLGNSLKFAAADRPLSVVLAVSATPAAVVIEVTDNGLGLPEDPEPLFAPGARGESARPTEGSGLGLAFARQAVEDLGGTLSAAPEPEGSTFRIELPTAVTAADRAPAPAGGSVAHGLSARQLDHIIERWPSPIVIVDLGTRRILRANESAGQLFGTRPDDLSGQVDRVLFADGSDIDGLRARAVEADGAGHFRRVVPIRAPGGAADTEVTLTTFEETTLAVLTIALPGMPG